MCVITYTYTYHYTLAISIMQGWLTFATLISLDILALYQQHLLLSAQDFQQQTPPTHTLDQQSVPDVAALHYFQNPKLHCYE